MKRSKDLAGDLTCMRRMASCPSTYSCRLYSPSSMSVCIGDAMNLPNFLCASSLFRRQRRRKEGEIKLRGTGWLRGEGYLASYLLSGYCAGEIRSTLSTLRPKILES
eukprot:1802426-Rhodomonas_salina.1